MEMSSKTALEFAVASEEYNSLGTYLLITLGKGDMCGLEFDRLKKEIDGESDLKNTNRLLIDASGYSGLIDSQAIGGLIVYSEEKFIALYGLNANMRRVEKILKDLESTMNIRVRSTKIDALNALERMVSKR